MSDPSLFILAFSDDFHGHRSPHKSTENRLTAAFASHGQRPFGSDRSHFDQGRVRQGEHEPRGGSGGREIGSLYQYFPSKEALVAALIDRHNRRVMQAVQGELAKALDLSIEEAVRRLVTMAVEAHRIDPKLHRALTEQIPRVGRLENVEFFNRQYLRALRKLPEEPSG